MRYLDLLDDLEDREVVSLYDELTFWSARFGMMLFRHLELRRGLSILDLGCGPGFPLFELAHAHGSSSRLVGVDLWREALRRAERKRRMYRLDNVQLLRADGAHLPLADTCFDLIVSNLGVNNFADPAASFAECARVAKPGARIALTTNVKGHMKELYAVFRETLRALGMEDRLGRLAENEDHRGTRESLAERLETAGFEVVRAIEEQCELRFIDGRALLSHPLTRLGFLGGWRRVVGAAAERTVFPELERRLDELAVPGELRMTVPMLYLEGRR